MEENKVKFNRKIISFGDSFGITVPKELIEFLNIKKGDEISMVGDEKGKGRFYCSMERLGYTNGSEKSTKRVH